MTNSHQGASFAPRPQLAKEGKSYHAPDLAALAQYLITNGFDPAPGRSKYEYSRFWNNGALVVTYHSGSVIVQGSAPELATSLLAALCVQGGQR